MMTTVSHHWKYNKNFLVKLAPAGAFAFWMFGDIIIILSIVYQAKTMRRNYEKLMFIKLSKSQSNILENVHQLVSKLTVMTIYNHFVLLCFFIETGTVKLYIQTKTCLRKEILNSEDQYLLRCTSRCLKRIIVQVLYTRFQWIR